MLRVLVLSFVFIDGILASETKSTKTVVFAFDAEDSVTHFQAGEKLSELDVQATFYYSSESKSRSKMAAWQVRKLDTLGHEIGGQTLFYVDLNVYDELEIQRQICFNRKWLITQNLRPVSFAYPFGEYSFKSSVSAVQCGYVSGIAGEDPQKRVNNLEFVLNENAFDIKTISLKETKNITQLQYLLEDVLPSNSTNTNVLVVFKIFEMCENCFRTGMSYNTLSSFVRWILNSRQDIEIKTMRNVMGDEFRPLPPGYIESGVRLLPETESKLIVAGSTIAGMIVFILTFFASEAIRNKCKKR